jgi:hypothetical protein
LRAELLPARTPDEINSAANAEMVTMVDPEKLAAIWSSPELVKWKPALVAQFVSDGRTATIPASDETPVTAVTVPMFHVPLCAADTG